MEMKEYLYDPNGVRFLREMSKISHSVLIFAL